MKQFVRGVARRSHRTVARQAMLSKKIRAHVLGYLKKDVQKEIKSICSKKVNSVLRETSADIVSIFSWELLVKEIEANAPTLLSLLCVCVDVQRRQRKRKSVSSLRKSKSRIPSNTAIIGVCAGIILRNANHHMNLVQQLISLILDNGHSSKQVGRLYLYSSSYYKLKFLMCAGLFQAAKDAVEFVSSSYSCLSQQTG